MADGGQRLGQVLELIDEESHIERLSAVHQLSASKQHRARRTDTLHRHFNPFW